MKPPLPANDAERVQALRDYAVLDTPPEPALDAIVAMDAAGKVVEFNPAAERMFGYTRSEAVGRLLSDLIIPPGLREQHGRGLGRFLATGQAANLGWRLEITALRRDGTEFPVELFFHRIGNTEPPLFTAFIRDITERKHAEEKYRRLFETSKDGIAFVALDGRIENANAAYCQMLGYTLEEVTRLTYQQITSAKWAAMERELVENQIFARGYADEYEKEYVRKDGTIFPVNVRAWLLRDEAGQPLRLLGVVRDITERTRAEEESRLMAERFIRQRNAVIALMQSEAFYSDDLAAALRRITEMDARTLGVARVSVWRYNRDRSAIQCVDLYELDANRHSSGIELSAAAFPAYFRALAEMDVIAADDARSDPRTSEFTESYLDPLGITSMMDAAIYLEGAVDGVLCHEHIGPMRLWTADEKTFAVTVANLVSLALEGAERQRAEAEARKNQERFAIVSRATNDAVWDWNLLTDALWWNEGYQTLFGYLPEETDPSLDSWIKFIHPEDTDRVVQGIHKVIDGAGQAWSDEYRFRRRDGTYAEIFDRGYVIRDPRGQPVRMIGAMQDITERKRAEEALRLAEARYHAIFEHAIEGIFQTTPDGRFIAVNPAMSRILGYDSPEELIADRTDITLQGYVNPERRGEFQRLIEESDVVMGFEYELICKDGSRKWVSENARAVRDAEGRIVFYEGSMEDITERKRGEAALRTSEKRFSKLFRANPAAMSINTVEEGRLTDVNDRYCKFFGYSREELIGQTIASLNLWANLADREAMLHRLRLEGTIRDLEAKFRCKSGEIRDVLISIELTEVPGESEPLIVSMFTDITGRKRLEEQLRQAQKMEAIGQLAGGVAHDFNNLLTVIQGHASLLRMVDQQSREAEDSVEQIAQAAERAANLTRQLLTFSRKQVMQQKNLDLNEIVSNMTRMLNRILGEDIQLQVEPSASLPLVHADAGMMEQVVLNLAINARDAMPRGGRLLIHTTVEQIDDDCLRQNPEATPGMFVRLGITDTGCGIPPESLPHIFEPFFTTKDVGKGTGLGLATVHGIVKQHRGWIRVYSEPGKRTTFHIFLPASGRHGKADDAGDEEKPVRGGTETVLVVEDEPALCELARLVLERHGYTVLEALNGVAGLAVWREHRESIDIVLTDMVMPGGLSGMDLAAKLLIEKPATKIIFSSGYSADVFGKELDLKDGLNFLQKPYHPRKLVQTVRECLDAR